MVVPAGGLIHPVLYAIRINNLQAISLALNLLTKTTPLHLISGELISTQPVDRKALNTGQKSRTPGSLEQGVWRKLRAVTGEAGGSWIEAACSA